jgi:putative hemolysin
MQALIGAILVILGLIVLYGLIGMAKFAVESARRSLLKEWSARGDRGARAALDLKENARGFFLAVEAANIFLATAAGLCGGIAVAPGVSQAIAQIPSLAPCSDAIGMVLTVFVIASVTLFLGEVFAQRAAAVRPEPIAKFAARPLRVFTRLIQPVLNVLTRATDRLFNALGLRSILEPHVTQEQIQILIHEGTKAGVFEEEEHELLNRVFRFSDRRARTLMTPRNEIVWIDLADSPEDIRQKAIASPHAQFPVGDGSLDNLLGIVQIKDLLIERKSVEPFRLQGRLTMPLFIYGGTRGLKILEMLKKSATRIAVVLDEYGTVEGLMTLTDILEAIVGDMPDATDEAEPIAVERPDGSWLLDGMMPLEEFCERFSLPPISQEEFHTLAGLVVHELGHIPRIAESFERWNLYFEVVDMDGRRVDRILVKPLEPKQSVA